MLYTKSKLFWLQEAVKESNKLLRTPSFIRLVREVPKFDYTKDSGEKVADYLLSAWEMEVISFRKYNPWSATVALNNGHLIKLNTWKNPRPMPQMVNTLVHETMHIWYGHGDNHAHGKENSVPYYVGNLAEKFMRGEL